MTMVRREPWTLERFLEWEERQEYKHEFDGTRPVAVAGVSEAHAMLHANLLFEVGSRLSRPPCRIVGSSLKVQVAGRIRYPDALITCSVPAHGRRIAAEPLVLFEILGEDTHAIDLVDKNVEYRAIDSMQRYVVLYQTRMAAIVFARRGDYWGTEIVAGETGALHLPEVDVMVPFADLYRGVPLPEP